jgi:beta-phosphoglucomutase
MAWKEIADDLKIPFDQKYNEKLKGISRMESLNVLLDNGPGRDVYTDSEKQQLAERKNGIYRRLISQMTPDDLLPGIGRVLREIKEEKILAGLASASNNAPDIISHLKIGQYFDYIANAVRVKNSKPEPDIYIDNLIHLHVRPEEAVGIEDAASGIEAIHRAGMRAVGVGTYDQMGKADLILDGTEKLSLDKLKALCG